MPSVWTADVMDVPEPDVVNPDVVEPAWNDLGIIAHHKTPGNKTRSFGSASFHGNRA